nr:diguanylate cyclase [Azospirillum melinis]
MGVLEALRQRVSAQRMACGGAVTISIGVGQARAGEDIDSLLQRVDAALYKAKAAGRNRIERA